MLCGLSIPDSRGYGGKLLVCGYGCNQLDISLLLAITPKPAHPTNPK